MDEFKTGTVLAESFYEQEWKDFVTVNGRRMFQIALLLSGGPNPAENSFIASVDDLDLSKAPGKDALAQWQAAIVTRSVRAAHCIPAWDPVALSMLQPGLWPLMRIVGRSRIYFILRVLLRYDTGQCAQMLNVKTSETHALLSEAMKQLQNPHRTRMISSSCRNL